MTPLHSHLAGLVTLGLVLACEGAGEEPWAWSDFNRRDGRYSVTKALVASRQPPGSPQRGRYEVFEDSDKGLGAFINRPDGFSRPDNRGPFLGNNQYGLDSGINNRRPGLLGGPGLEQGLGRPGFPGERPLFGGGPNLRPPVDGRPPGPIDRFPARPPLGFNPRPGLNKPTPPTVGGNAPGILTGPVASWEKPNGPIDKDPTHFDTCKCKHSFNCKSPGIQFGSCDEGKVYCCYNDKGLRRGPPRPPFDPLLPSRLNP